MTGFFLGVLLLLFSFCACERRVRQRPEHRAYTFEENKKLPVAVADVHVPSGGPSTAGRTQCCATIQKGAPTLIAARLCIRGAGATSQHTLTIGLNVAPNISLSSDSNATTVASIANYASDAARVISIGRKMMQICGSHVPFRDGRKGCMLHART